MIEYVARTEDVVLEVLDGGAMVYDTRSDQAHWLDHDALAIWRACAQRATEAHVVRCSGVDPIRCVEALERLADVGLVVRHGGVSRRSALATVARVGAAGVVGAPVISVLIPAAAAHASTPGLGGGSNPQPTPVTTTFNADGTLVLAAHQVATYSLIGGGGAAGYYGPGGFGGSISGTITNLTNSSQTLTIVIGTATNGGGGGVGYGNGGQAGNYGGGGGSASAILDGTTALVIAGGGGGGGFSFSNVGGNGGAGTGTSTAKANGGDGGFGSGGGGANGGSGGHGYSGGGGGNNDSHPDTTFAVTTTSSGASSGAAGSPGAGGTSSQSPSAYNGAAGSATLTA